MRALEKQAEEAFLRNGDHAIEFVGLGFLQADESVVWYELPNQAGVGEFLVDGEDVLHIVQRAQAEGHENGLGRVLWHSHYRSQHPSDSDMNEFPAWLVDYGVVYHAPTRQTVVYNSGGILSTTEPESATLATGAS